jgi:hypothetical protein
MEELVWLFETDPLFDDDRAGYPASATTFTTRRHSTEIEFTIEAFAASVTVRLSEAGEERLRLHLWGIVDTVELDRSSGHEALVASMIAGVPFRALRLELKPTPRVWWESVPFPS